MKAYVVKWGNEVQSIHLKKADAHISAQYFPDFMKDAVSVEAHTLVPVNGAE